MHLSSKGRYAVNAMVDLALRETQGPVALAGIATRQRISLSYLEQLFARLRRAGLVSSTRGPGGGYTLGRELSGISVADVVMAVEEETDPESQMPTRGEDLTGTLWADLDDVLLRHLATVPLKSLVDAQHARGFVAEAKPARRMLASVPTLKPLRSLAPNSVFAFGQRFAR